MAYISRKESLERFGSIPAFRWKQIETALFDTSITGWNDISTLPKSMRERLQDVPWMSLEEKETFASQNGDTYKAAITVEGGEIETVLMKNRRGYWTICVSSQVGCAMACSFCATGKMGLTRNLHADEIIDQYRFWQQFLAVRPELQQRISNIVYMGMGEPMANYLHVRESVNTILRQTEIGLTRITVSTVGVLPRLEMLLNDDEWPHVRLAISLHSADPKTRKEIVPTSYDDFLPKLADWSKRYLEKFGNRRHHLTFEYVMLSGVNDTSHHAKMLAQFALDIGDIRVNLIPYNFTGCAFTCSTKDDLAKFKQLLEEHGVTVTQRKTMGDDIAAACGQLVRKEG